MKKIVLFNICLIVMTSMTTLAQQRTLPMRSKIDATGGSSAHRLERIERTTIDGQRLEKGVMEYDEEGNLSVVTQFSYGTDGNLVPQQKVEHSYNKNGLLQQTDTYVFQDGISYQTERQEVLQYSFSGQPLVVVVSEGNGSQAGLQPYLKQVVTGIQQDRWTDYDLYMWLMGDWELIAQSHMDYSDDGNWTREVLTYVVYGLNTSQVVEFSYDEHHQPVRCIEYYLEGDEQTFRLETTYKNEYDSDDCLKRMTMTSGDDEPIVNHYFWKKEATTAVSDVPAGNVLKPDSYYDVSGRRHKEVPSKPGLYIVNGKKIMLR